MIKFLVVGNINTLYTKSNYPLLKSGKVWISKYSTISIFNTPDSTVKLGNTCWLTNLKYCSTTLPLKKYYEHNYYKYENYDAINVDRLEDIPNDYYGVMGVPVTILQKWDDRFELVGIAHGELAKTIKGLTPMPFELDRQMKGHSTRWILYYKNNKGEYIRPYIRILIRRKRQ